jgi:hypothetical protein
MMSPAALLAMANPKALRCLALDLRLAQDHEAQTAGDVR